MTPSRGVDASFFVEASAGTGKTTQLIEQIVRCVAAGTHLAGVVAVTFTHAAAGEMKLRLREELGKAGLSSARASSNSTRKPPQRCSLASSGVGSNADSPLRILFFAAR